MKILLLGAGLQGRTALWDLAKSPCVSQLIVADLDVKRLKSYVDSMGLMGIVDCRHVDINDPHTIHQLFVNKPDVVLDLLPVQYVNHITQLALEYCCHLVNTCYTTAEMRNLGHQALESSISFLPECGMDPGLDMILLQKALIDFDTITRIRSYGAGIPHPDAIDNPLKYKITWTLSGVLRAYCREGVILEHGDLRIIPGNSLFKEVNTHLVNINGLGVLEAFVSGNAAPYLELLGDSGKDLDHLGRYTLRWPGHCAFWEKLIALGFLDSEPVQLGKLAVDRQQYLSALLEPQLLLAELDQDMAIVRIEVDGARNGVKGKGIYQITDTRDLQTGFTAMSRLVGFTASIAAQLLGSGKLEHSGLLSPLVHLPYSIMEEELKQRNIDITIQFYPE